MSLPRAYDQEVISTLFLLICVFGLCYYNCELRINASRYKAKFRFGYTKLMVLLADGFDYLKSGKTDTFAIVYSTWRQIPLRC